MSFFGIVILPRPAVPLGPVILKETVVMVGLFDVIVALDICELVTFPLMARSTMAPLPVVTGTVVAEVVGVGDGVGVRVALGV
jgi:uncharacterized ion transporter superfamily protein YfcC